MNIQAMIKDHAKRGHKLLVSGNADSLVGVAEILKKHDYFVIRLPLSDTHVAVQSLLADYGIANPTCKVAIIYLNDRPDIAWVENAVAHCHNGGFKIRL